MNTVTWRNGGKSLPVQKIFCLGRNYAGHAKEMLAEVPGEPVVFLKPPTAVLPAPGRVLPPRGAGEVHHEVEMVALLGGGGRNIRAEGAETLVAGYGVGLDMTLRDLQSEAKRNGLPWTLAKGFDTSAPLSEFAAAAEVPDPYALDITLRVNGALRQQGNTRDMIFRLGPVIAFLSRYFTLEAGDLIFTGTPEGVGPVQPGDVLEADLLGVASLRVEIG